LRQHVCGFCGRSLVHAKTDRELFMAIAHAMLGYWNMLRKGFQHRDISIGNVLLCEDPQTKRPLSQALGGLVLNLEELDTRKARLEKLITLLQRLKIDDKCRGFVIDGDLAVHLPEYFANTNPFKAASRSGTAEFMSRGLILAACENEPYLQSPVDDLFSYFFVSLWAVIYHREDSLGAPAGLTRLRESLIRSTDSRTAATSDVASHTKLKVDRYGQFLVSCQPFLKEWYDKLDMLRAKWMELLDSDPSKDTLAESFCDLYETGVVEYLELFIKVYGLA